MGKLTLPELISKVDSLPELPQVALRVSQMMENPETHANELAEVIRLDANMTAQLLRLCNSAAYAPVREIGTVRDAVAVIGFKALKSIIYTVISHAALNRDVPGYSLSGGALWANAIHCAVYARQLSVEFGYPDPELAFTAGLMRDIGKIVLGEHVGANYPEIEATASQEQIDFMVAEERVLGYSHTEVGTQVARKWNLPSRLVNVIRFHHQPSSLIGISEVSEDVSEEELKLVTLVHLADAFTMMLGTGVGSDGMMYSIDYAALNHIGFDTSEANMERILSELVDMSSVVQEMTGAFNLQGA
jgi:putative nucleotidyltransferase with HDIG domain